jgi:hypothetical protein
MSPVEQARLRKKRQRAELTRRGLEKVEVFLPSKLKAAVKKACGKTTLSDAGAQAFQLWLKANSR